MSLRRPLLGTLSLLAAIHGCVVVPPGGITGAIPTEVMASAGAVIAVQPSAAPSTEASATPSAAPSAEPSATPSPTPSPEPTPSATPEPEEPIVFGGDGRKKGLFGPFRLTAGVHSFKAAHGGQGNFVVRLVTADDGFTGVNFNEIGVGEFDQDQRVSETGDYYFDVVLVDGAWGVSIDQPGYPTMGGSGRTTTEREEEEDEEEAEPTPRPTAKPTREPERDQEAFQIGGNSMKVGLVGPHRLEKGRRTFKLGYTSPGLIGIVLKTEDDDYVKLLFNELIFSSEMEAYRPHSKELTYNVETAGDYYFDVTCTGDMRWSMDVE